MENYATIQQNTASASAILKGQRKYQNLCENYATIIDDSRLFSYPYREYKCDFFYESAVRFISSKGLSLQLKEKCSSEETNATRYYCGGNGLTYLEQSHPDIADGPTQISGVLIHSMLLFLVQVRQVLAQTFFLDLVANVTIDKIF